MSDPTPTDRSILHIDRSAAAAALLWAVVGGLGGATGTSMLQDDHQPAVVAQAVDLLREDVRELSGQLRELRTATERDRWTRRDHQEWVRDTYAPTMTQLHQRVRALEERRP